MGVGTSNWKVVAGRLTRDFHLNWAGVRMVRHWFRIEKGIEVALTVFKVFEHWDNNERLRRRSVRNSQWRSIATDPISYFLTWLDQQWSLHQKLWDFDWRKIYAKIFIRELSVSSISIESLKFQLVPASNKLQMKVKIEKSGTSNYKLNCVIFSIISNLLTP